jgi:putative ABC transport system substrate-binding protein
MAIYIRRREFISTLGSVAAAWPLTSHAQQPNRVRRIGVLMSYAESDSDAQAWYGAFREGTPEAWVDGGSQHPNRHSLGNT